MIDKPLLVFNLATDADDPILSFTTAWINRLAAHFARVDVITMRAGRIAVAPHVQVFSVGKERGWSEPRRALAFYRRLAERLTRERYAAAFAHMMPLFAAMGAPLLRAARVPITTWYTHRQPDRTLRPAIAVSRRIVTAVPDSFPIPTPKLRAIGHGIDTDFFAPAPPALPNGAHGARTIVQVARLMPIKRQDLLLRAAAPLMARAPDVRVQFIGDAPADHGEAQMYKRGLIDLARELGIADRVTFSGSLDAVGVREALRAAAVAVNLSPRGLFDKAALESMAVGTLTLVTNPAFREVLGDSDSPLYLPLADRLEPRDPSEEARAAVRLGERLGDLLTLDAAHAAAIRAIVRGEVGRLHSLDALIPRLVSVLLTGEG